MRYAKIFSKKNLISYFSTVISFGTKVMPWCIIKNVQNMPYITLNYQKEVRSFCLLHGKFTLFKRLIFFSLHLSKFPAHYFHEILGFIRAPGVDGFTLSFSSLTTHKGSKVKFGSSSCWEKKIFNLFYDRKDFWMITHSIWNY